MFKAIIVLLALTALGAQVHSQSLTMEEALLRFFEAFRCRMTYEQDNIDLPILEPYTEEKISFEFNDDSLGSFDILFRNLTVEGLSTFHVPDLMFNLFTLDFWLYLEVPQLTISGWYSLSGEVQDMLELRGSGDFQLVIEGINVFMEGQQGYEGYEHTWWLNSLGLTFAIDKLSGHMGGIMNDEVLEDFFNDLLNNAGPQLIAEVFPDLEPEIVKYAKEMVPDLLNGTPLLDLINIIFLEKEFLMEMPGDEQCAAEIDLKKREG